MPVLIEVVRVVAQLTAGAFAGACLYIAVVQQPVRVALPPAGALDDFRRTIPYAERLQAPLLVASIVASVLGLVLGFRWTTAVGGLLLVVVLVQTTTTVLPINRRLLSGSAADHVDGAQVSISRWGRLHAVRTAVAVIAAAVLLS